MTSCTLCGQMRQRTVNSDGHVNSKGKVQVLMYVHGKTQNTEMTHLKLLATVTTVVLSHYLTHCHRK